jgi:hypothetical protein
MAAYKTDFFQRAVVLNNAAIAAGTYRRGELLSLTAGTGVFGPYGAGPVAAVCVNDIDLAAPGNAAVAKGEYEKEAVVAVNAGLTVPVTVNNKIIGECFAAGIFLN